MVVKNRWRCRRGVHGAGGGGVGGAGGWEFAGTGEEELGGRGRVRRDEVRGVEEVHVYRTILFHT